MGEIKESRLVNRREAAKRLGLSVTTFDRHVRLKTLPLEPIYIGRLKQFKEKDIEAIINGKVTVM